MPWCCCDLAGTSAWHAQLGLVDPAPAPQLPLPLITCANPLLAGEGQISEQRIVDAVAATPEAPGRLRAICRQLSLLAREALPRPAVAEHGDGTFHAGWTNPLFGSAPTVSAQS